MSTFNHRPLIPALLILGLSLLLAACGTGSIPVAPEPTPTAVPSTPLPTSTPPVPTAVPTNPPPPTATVVPTASPTAPPCLSPDPAVWGTWCFESQLFFHPIALDQLDATFYLLDGGRVLALSQFAPPLTLLAPGDVVSDTRVIEPLDLVAGSEELLVLDRAGDVYRYDPTTAVWTLDRYDRPSGIRASHYYVALDLLEQDRYLLDAGYRYGLRYQIGSDTEANQESGWLLPEGQLVDMALWRTAEGVSHAYVLVQSPFNTGETQLIFYEAGQEVTRFRPDVDIAFNRPREVRVSDTAVYVLDEAGNRLTRLDPRTGRVQNNIPLPRTLSTFWVSPDDSQLVLAGRDALYFWQQPEKTQTIRGGEPLTGAQPHDTAVWQTFVPRLWPVQGAQLPGREIQMPGAPRHYRFGVHEGVDFYWAAGKEIRAAADGVVMRVMHDYIQPYPADYFNQRQAARQAGYTPPDALDFYRGRQLWLQYSDGTVGRYAHLQAIDPTLQVGDAVTQGQIVAWIGNSGTPASETNQTEDAHLHYEIWLNDNHYLGQFIRPSEAREWFATLFMAISDEQ